VFYALLDNKLTLFLRIRTNVQNNVTFPNRVTFVCFRLRYNDSLNDICKRNENLLNSHLYRYLLCKLKTPTVHQIQNYRYLTVQMMIKFYWDFVYFKNVMCVKRKVSNPSLKFILTPPIHIKYTIIHYRF